MDVNATASNLSLLEPVSGNLIMNLIASFAYVLNLGCSVFLIWFSWIEKSKSFSNFRPVTQQLLSFCLFEVSTIKKVHFLMKWRLQIKFLSKQGSLANIIYKTIDIIRVWFGPEPYYLCSFNIFLKNFSFITVCVIFSCLTIMKFLFLCVLRRIPEMDDDYVSSIIIRSVTFSVFVICGSNTWTYEHNIQHESFYNIVLLILVLAK